VLFRSTLFVVVRTATDSTALGPSIQRKARERSPEVSVRLTTLNALLAEHVAVLPLDDRYSCTIS